MSRGFRWLRLKKKITNCSLFLLFNVCQQFSPAIWTHLAPKGALPFHPFHGRPSERLTVRKRGRLLSPGHCLVRREMVRFFCLWHEKSALKSHESFPPGCRVFFDLTEGAFSGKPMNHEASCPIREPGGPRPRVGSIVQSCLSTGALFGFSSAFS